MSKNGVVSKIFGFGGSEPVEKDSPFFTISPKTIRYGHGSEIYPLKNIVRFGKYNVSEWKLPWLGILICFGLGVSMVYTTLNTPTIETYAGGGIVLFGVYGLWQRFFRKPKLAFGVETSSGCSHYITTRDEEFVDEVVKTVSSFFEEELPPIAYHINIDEAKIEKMDVESIINKNKSVNVSGGSTVQGDIVTGKKTSEVADENTV